MNQQELKEYAKIFRALSNSNRLKIFCDLLTIAQKNRENRSDSGTEDAAEDSVTFAQESCFLGALTERLNICSPTISHHLRELEHAGLIETEKEGKFLRLRLNRKTWDKFYADFFAGAGDLQSSP